MTLFYMHARHDEDQSHDCRVEMRDLQEAKEEIVGYLTETARDKLVPDRERQEIVCTLKNAKGDVVLQASLTLQIDGP